MHANLQKRLLEVLLEAINTDESLSLQDLANKLEVRSPNTILYQMKKLEDKGLITRNDSGKVVQVSARANGESFAYLPLLGNAACGTPIESVADDSTIRMIPIPLRLLNKQTRENLYIIEAVGDSMFPKIESGDYVVFEGKTTPDQGDIVVARTQNGFTVKKYQENQSQIILSPTNPAHIPLVFEKKQGEEAFGIDGVAVGVFKPENNL